MDVLIVPDARREIEAFRVFRPRAGTWGILVGHRRGPRYIVEKLVTAGRPGRVPGGRVVEELDRIWPGGVIGLAVARPDAALKKAMRSPAWYGKVILEPAGTAKAPVLRACVVEFDRRFLLEAVPIAAAAKEEKREGDHE